MSATIRLMTLITLLALASGCRPFDIETLDNFVELDEGRHSRYDYRATTADGIVLSVRAIENDRRGQADFWAEAVRTKLRDGRGYALLEEQDVTAGGMAGKQIRFGRDESGHTYRYWVTIFVRHLGRKPMVWIIETGGEQAVFEQRQEEIERMIASFRPR